MSEADDAMKAVEDCTAGFDEAEVLSFEVTWLRKQEAALRARVAELESGGVKHEWGALWPGDESEVLPSLAGQVPYLAHALRAQGVRLVQREVVSYTGPWVDAPAPSVPSGEETP